MSRRSVFFEKGSSVAEILSLATIPVIGSFWMNPAFKLVLMERVVIKHQRGRFKVVCVYRSIGNGSANLH